MTDLELKDSKGHQNGYVVFERSTAGDYVALHGYQNDCMELQVQDWEKIKAMIDAFFRGEEVGE